MRLKTFKIVALILVSIISGLVTAQDYAYDRKAGSEAARQVEAMIGIYQDSAVSTYVREVGTRLVAALGTSPVEFTFQVVDMTEPNAFALPGGFIFVSRGLLGLLNDEAELAGVIGHEMIHVTKRHSVKQMKKSVWPSLLQLPGAIVGGLVSEDLGNIINAPISLGSELFLMNYSRKQESESDRYGIELASEAGYNPYKLAEILSNLSKEIELLTGESEKKSYFSSHPFTPKRIDEINKWAATIPWTESPSIASTRSDLYSRLEGMYVDINPAQGIFMERTLQHPDLMIAVTFPEEWKTFNIPVAAGASEPEGRGQVFIKMEDQFTHPDSAAHHFVSQLAKAYRVNPVSDRQGIINGFPMHEVTFEEASEKQIVRLSAWWIQKDKMLFGIFGISTPEFSGKVSQVAESFRELSQEERSQIFGNTLKMITAQPGESLERVSARTENQWDMPTTAVMNAIPQDIIFSEETRLKIAVKTYYAGSGM